MAMDNGKMDRFDLIPGAFQRNHLINYTALSLTIKYLNYWAWASRFCPWPMNSSPRSTARASPIICSPSRRSQAERSTTHSVMFGVVTQQDPVVPIIDPNGKRTKVPPCFDITTVADSLNSAGLTWRYYGPGIGSSGYHWSAFDAIRHIRFGSPWRTNVLPLARFSRDVAANKLATMTWITTYTASSEHPRFGEVCAGENSTVEMVDAIMKSPEWNSTVIFVSWDDFGGFYDHVPPPQLDALGLGPRVPLLIISPFVKSGFIEHQQLEFASVVKFVEEVFGLPFLTSRDTNSNDMFDAFDFVDAPLPPDPLLKHRCQ